MGLAAVAGIATAMVPSAALLIGMSTLVSRNIFRTSSERRQFTITQVTVVVATFFALVLALVMPNLLANLLLITFSGLDQLAPAIALASFLPKQVSGRSVTAGLLAGLLVVILCTFWLTAPGAISVGIFGLVANLIVLVVVEAARRSTGMRSEHSVDAHAG
ncbi:MAG: hypothetical protein L0H79_19675 [Intrasporangium sp.]|uniref:hypothetical protein n=1 Tax=Intrasporangium sp. TaxID=1925024 RepID=UPI00264A4576|nr:hypothetical protein [Intrasporangium sp.]MDN5797945.1 hypothetical protein [Intrasporangium sp.]